MSSTGIHQTGVRTIGIGGAAGDGVREAGVHTGEFARRIGQHAFLAFYYPSLIRGGHNFARVTYAPEPVHADHALLDVYVALSSDALSVRQHELAPDALVIVEEAHSDAARAIRSSIVTLPMGAFVKELNAPHAATASSAFGVIAFAAGIGRDEFAGMCADIFSDLVGGRDINTQLALKGYDHAAGQNIAKKETLRGDAPHAGAGALVEGNKAVALGLLAAGLKFYVAYPMTPSTSILHFLAKEATTGRLEVIHPEDEIGVINMALGVAYTGTRVAIGTANGGFALMQEAFSFAGVSELPLVAVVSQRQGPATGVATHTGQSDLRFVIHAGHGEFPRLVLAPGDVKECYEAGIIALNLAWKYQTPAIILLDKHISESHASVDIDLTATEVEDIVRWDPSATPDYKRFAITESGVSPLAFPGTPGAHVKATSYEHDEFGSSEDDAAKVLAMQEKRWRKDVGLRSEFVNYPTVKVYGDPNAETALVFWGSTKGAVLEAAGRIDQPIRLVQVLWMEPFDAESVAQALRGATRIIAIEGNHGAQLAGLIREKTGIAATETLLKYDSEPFEPAELAEELRRRLG